MNRDGLTEAMGYIDPAYVEEADVRGEAKPGRRWRRPALIAACLCLVLAGTALAAELAGVHVSDFFEGTVTDFRGRERDAVSYEYQANGIRRIPGDSLAPAVSEYIARTRGSDEGYYYITRGVGSMERAEEFLGLDLPDNPVLDQAKHGWTYFAKGDSLAGESRISNGFCGISLHGAGELPETIQLRLAYDFPSADDYYSVSVDVSMRLYTDECDSSVEEGEVWGRVSMWQDKAPLEKYTYTASSGLETTVLAILDTHVIMGEEIAYYDYTAYFVLDGILFEVLVSDTDGILARETMEQILDGFVYEAPAQP